MSREDQEPMETKGFHDDPKFTHPAFGVIRTHQVSGGTTLFGSDFIHNNYISLEICEAYMERQFHADRISGEKIIVKINMSESQGAHFVSSHGKHEGTPVTLRYTPEPSAKLVATPGIPHRVATNSFDPEARARVRDVEKQLAELEKLLTDDLAKLSKADRARALQHIRRAQQQIGPNLEFIADQMAEHLESKVTKAKIEVYAWMNNTIRSAGMDAIASRPIEVAPLVIAPSKGKGE